jgi:hypothetical protein
MPEPSEPQARLDVRAAGPHEYAVTITHHSGAETAHSVAVPESLMAELGASAAQEPLLVHASLAFLLEHAPAALPDRFDLDEIGRAIPEYLDEIAGRL